MVPAALRKQWRKEETASFEGWDFSYLKGRRIEEQLPWDYQTMAKELVRRSKAVLDMGTGGGEIFSSFAPFPRHAIAIEGYKPNVEVAKKRLEPLGVKVLEVDESYNLPFANSEFDLVLNRHSAFRALEVFRILNVGGTFLTQQVGGDDLNDLISTFDAVPKYKDWTLENVENEIRQTGFTIKEAKGWKGKVEFKDVGAIVYFLKAVPWAVDGFGVDRNINQLEKLQEKIERGKKLIFTQVRFLICAGK